MRRWLLGGTLLLAALLAAALWLRPGREIPVEPPVATVTSVLGDGETEGFARALRPGSIELPRDHGPHDDYRSEWWYFTGNLATASGREFGFQLTFFRFALAPPVPRQSDWATNQVFMAHFAVTDIAANDHRVTERFARSAAGLGGASSAPFRAWLDDWSAASTTGEFLPLQLTARDAPAGIALSLVLQPGKPPVLQGEDGLSAKGEAPGNASWYYSYTRLPAAGIIAVDGESHQVEGLAWLDREWSTSALDADVVGWDWFSLQLEDGRDLMLYSLRRRDGSSAPQSAGSLVLDRGTRRALTATDFRLSPQSSWQSPHSGIEWPVAWRVQVPGADLDVEVRAAVSDQEQNLAVRYWEGAVEVFATASDARIGRGYLELTGYRAPLPNSRR